MDSYIRTESGFPSSLDAQSGSVVAHQENRSFRNRGTSVMSFELEPLIPDSDTSTSPPNVNIGERVTHGQEVRNLNRKIRSYREGDGRPDNQSFDEVDQVSPSRINKRNSELETLLSTLHNHPKATEAHKNKIKPLKIEIETLIQHSEEDPELDQEDTDDFVDIILNEIKERLALIEKYLNNPAFPEDNIDCLYNLARCQLKLYEVPYTMVGFMLVSLKKEESQSASIIPNASKTRKTVDRMLDALPHCEAMGNEQIKQFLGIQKCKVSDFIESTEHNEQLEKIKFGVKYHLYKMGQMPGLLEDQSQLNEILTQQFGFSSDDINESIFSVLHGYFSASITLKGQFISLLTALDEGSGYSDTHNLYNLQAERWSFAVLELGLSGNHLGDGEDKFIDEILNNIETLQDIAKKQAGIITADSSVFLDKLFGSKNTEPPSTASGEALTTSVNQAFEGWLLNGLLHFFDDVFDNPEFDKEVKDYLTGIKDGVKNWLLNTRRHTEGSNKLTELTDAIERVSTLIKNIRKLVCVDSAHPLLDQMFETQFNESARKFVLSQNIRYEDELSPFEQIVQIFENLEERLENQKRGVFDKDSMKRAFVGNCRVNTQRPVEPWHIKFVESVLSTKKHSTTKESSDREDTLKTDFLQRSLKNPSVLGKSLAKIGEFVVGRFIPKPYHETHKFVEDTSHENSGLSCRVNLCCSEGEGYDTDDEGAITINWKESIGCTAKNYLQDHDANHAPNGELEENIGGLEYAIPTHDVLKNWYEVFKKSTAIYFTEYSETVTAQNPLADSGETTRQPSKTAAIKARNDGLPVKKEQLPETLRQQQEALFELYSLTEKKTSVDLDHGSFLIERLRSLWPRKPSSDEKRNLKSLEEMVSRAVDHYRKSQFSQMAPQNKAPVAPLESMTLLPEQRVFCERLAPFFSTIIREICSKDFRHDLTADLHSVQIITQITGFLNIPLAAEAEAEVESEPQKMYELLGLGDKTFQTLEEYTRRLTSEHFEHKKDLLAERFYEVFSKAPPISRKKSSFLTALKNHDVNDFMADVEKELEKNASSQTQQPLKGIKSVMESVQESYAKVLENLNTELLKARLNDCNLCCKAGDESYYELSPEEYRQKLQNKIQAGKDLMENLNAIIEELQLGNESLTAPDRWTRVSEWIENHEASIMGTYGAAMLISIYYLAMGGTHPPHMYSTGGQLNFGSFEVTSWLPEQLYTSVDVAQVATTAGAIFTQFGQATGWKNDIRRMLDLLEGADAFSLVTSQIPTTLQSAMLNHFLAESDPVGNQASFESICENGNYRPSRRDTAKDVLASLFTRKSPLQQSHPIIDRTLRVTGSTATGALQGTSFWFLSSLLSTACSPFCSWVPTIGESCKVMTSVGAIAGSIGGLTSETRLDYISRGLNFSTRVFGSDRTVGGMSALIAQAIKTMRNRENSTLMRLLIENPFKAALNISGFSFPESAIKFFLHLFDGFIAQIEIGDFAEWRKAHQKLLSTAAAINKAFEGKVLTKYDLAVLKETLGEESVKQLNLKCRMDPKSCDIGYKKNLAVMLNLLGYYVMIADLYYFLYLALRHADKPIEGKVTTGSGTTEKRYTSPAPHSSEPTPAPHSSEPIPATGEDATFTVSGNSTSSINEPTCRADTKKLPKAGEGKQECWLAMYEEFRKGAPLRRFVDVALFKSLPNLARYFEVQAHNAALGKKSNDPAMATTLMAGIAKNSALGPMERLLQMSPSVLTKCAADVVNQLNTNLKESCESIGQRNRDKATEAMKKAAKDIVWRLLENKTYDLSKAETDMIKLVTYWQEEIGFQKLNVLASMREMIIKDQLKQCSAATKEFAEYKESVLEQLKNFMPSIVDQSFKVPEGLISQVEKLRGIVEDFTNSMNNGKDLFRAVAPLFDELSGMDLKVIDAYIESELFKPLLNQPEFFTPLPSKSYDASMERTDTPLHLDGLRRRGQHVFVA